MKVEQVAFGAQNVPISKQVFGIYSSQAAWLVTFLISVHYLSLQVSIFIHFLRFPVNSLQVLISPVYAEHAAVLDTHPAPFVKQLSKKS